MALYNPSRSKAEITKHVGGAKMQAGRWGVREPRYDSGDAN